MKIALVYDRINKFGGAEQVLLALHNLFPDAPLYTAVYDAKAASWANVFSVRPSLLQYIPFAKHHHEFFPWLTSFMFENFSFDQFDVVISITSAEAKSIITKPSTLHVCYCLTPTRYLWSGYNEYVQQAGMGNFSFFSQFALKKMRPLLQKWDLISSSRPDIYVAISDHIKKRIETYYQHTVSQVIYPPVDIDTFTLNNTPKSDFYLVVSRLVSYKRIDLLVEVFNNLHLPLVVIGQGKDEQRLRKMAGNTITFVTEKLTADELARYYRQARAFVFAGQEDFGIVAAESLACGTPVICYKDSGMAEIITRGKTGEVFEKQTVSCLSETITNFKEGKYKAADCRAQSLQFSTEQFQEKFKTFIDSNVKEYYSR